MVNSNALPSKNQRGESDDLVLAPDLERPVVSLANNIQRAVAALYTLHTALINTLAVTNPLLDQFRRSRDAFRLECNNLTLFLQHCHGHAEAYASFCQFTLSRSPSECLAPFSDIFAGATKILREADDITFEHGKGYKELLAFTQTVPSPTFRRSRVRRRASPDASASQFLSAAHAALRPGILQSESTSHLALEDIGVSLGEILAFWDDHFVHLAAVSEQRVELIRPRIEVLKSVESWTRYQSILLAAISSIAESSDAVMAVPVDGPSERPFPSASWAHCPRLLSFFHPKALHSITADALERREKKRGQEEDKRLTVEQREEKWLEAKLLAQKYQRGETPGGGIAGSGTARGESATGCETTRMEKEEESLE